MDDIDRQILALFQREIPLKPAPFEILSRMIRIDSGELLLRVNRLQEEGLMGSMKAVFSAEKLGYRSYSIVMQTAPEKLEQAAYFISGHPGVVQCGRWRGIYNLGFTLVLPPGESLEFHAFHLKNLSDANAFFVLETQEVFKPASLRREKKQEKPAVAEDWTALEKSLIRCLQAGFPLTDRPYRKIAGELNSTEELVLTQLIFFRKKGILKRIASPPAGRAKPAFEMLVLWDFPEEKIAEAGSRVAEMPEVLFCAKRRPCEGLPYNLHAVLGASQEELFGVAVDRVESFIGMWPRRVLVKEKEDKRSQVKFFSDEIAEWRIQHAGFPVSSVR